MRLFSWRWRLTSSRSEGGLPPKRTKRALTERRRRRNLDSYTRFYLGGGALPLMLFSLSFARSFVLAPRELVSEPGAGWVRPRL